MILSNWTIKVHWLNLTYRNTGHSTFLCRLLNKLLGAKISTQEARIAFECSSVETIRRLRDLYDKSSLSARSITSSLLFKADFTSSKTLMELIIKHFNCFKNNTTMDDLFRVPELCSCNFAEPTEKEIKIAQRPYGYL